MATTSSIPDYASARELLRMIRGYWISQSISVAAQLGLADLLWDGPRSCADLALAIDMPAHSLHRLLRALAGVGVFAAEKDDVFANSPLSRWLARDIAGSLHPSAVVAGEVLLPAWEGLHESLISESPQPFEARFGAPFFRYLAQNERLGAAFQGMMANVNVLTNDAVATQYDFSESPVIVDVGGGNGSLLGAILTRHPNARGVLFDLPHVISQAHANLDALGVLDRCELVSGSFFEAVPEGGNIYLMRWILHDYDDVTGRTILQNCRSAMDPNGRMLIIEQLIPDSNLPDDWSTAFLDLQMLLLLGGQERTRGDFVALLESSGFTLRAATAINHPHWILEASPV